MSEAGSSNEPTILDYLNEDCWRAVLQYVPVKKIIQSERVSRRWQMEVLRYLRQIRIAINHHSFNVCGSLRNLTKVTLTRKPGYSFHSWTRKLGPSVVAIYCEDEETLNVVGENCPNLEALTIMDIPEVQLMRNKSENFRWLQRLCFKRCGFIRDSCITKFINHESLQELELHQCNGVTGQCLVHLKPNNLKTLVLLLCNSLKLVQMITAADRLSELTRFELYSRKNMSKNFHMLLTKMAKLEHLIMSNETITADSLFDYVCQLDRLKSLHVDTDITDDRLEAVARSCKELRSLMLTNCSSLTGRGLVVACAHMGARLTELGLRRCDSLSDDDVVACIRACPNLLLLKVSRCRGLTSQLAARASAARHELCAARPLTIHGLDAMMEVDRYYEP